MKKIGIITIYDNKNYGNRLQNYALQKNLEELGFEVQTILNVPYTDFKFMGPVAFCKAVKRFLIRLIHGKEKTIRKDTLQWKYKCLDTNVNSNRYKAFAEFDKKINKYPEIILYYNAKELKSKFDFFITGSDQVWNCTIGRASGIDFLTFADPSQRVAYAASISLDRVPKEYEKRYKHYLSGMSSISMREIQGLEILKNQFSIKSEVVLDPTMLLTDNEWRSVAVKTNVLPRKYILCMFLGDEQAGMIDKIYTLAANQSCELIFLNSKDYPEYYDFGPGEFLEAIDSAEYIFTDSFHGCVFSILFHKDFYVLHRFGRANNMYSRIKSLLTLFNLNNRELDGNTILTRIENKQWKDVEMILAQQRNISNMYIKKALSL